MLFVPKSIDAQTTTPDQREKAQRRASIEALAQIKSPESIKKLSEILAAAKLPEKSPAQLPATDELAFAALAALYETNIPDSTKVVEELIVERRYPTDLRRQAVRLIGRTPAGCRYLLSIAEKGQLLVDTKGDASEATNRCSDKEVQELASMLLPLPKLADNRPLPPLQEILTKKGDAQKGQAVFIKAECVKCHRVGGIGSWVGPDLAHIGAKLATAGLLDAILNPSAAIAHDYVQYSIETGKGAIYAGIIVDETPKRLVLKNPLSERFHIPIQEIAHRVALPVSIMPEGLVQKMTEQDVVDLLAYLGTLRQPAAPVAHWHVIGPFETGKVPPELIGKVDLKASFAGKGGGKVSWQKISADREGRIDLEAALGTRSAVVFLHAVLESKSSQDGRLVLLIPPDASVSGRLNGKELRFRPVKPWSDLKVPMAQVAGFAIQARHNELLLRIDGGNTQLTATSTVVSPLGVELSASGN